MIGDRDKFLTLIKERYGSFSFGNDDSTKIIGKGTVRIGKKNTKEENVLLVEDMKHNLLSMTQMCDQGHKVTFYSQKCEIRKEGSGKLIATATRTSSNIFVLSEIGNEKCCLGKEDESLLWNRRMDYILFDNLVKFIKREEVIEMPQITKPTNKHFMKALSIRKENKDQVQIKGIFNEETTGNCAHRSSWTNYNKGFKR
jgi:hypothetical protein